MGSSQSANGHCPFKELEALLEGGSRENRRRKTRLQSDYPSSCEDFCSEDFPNIQDTDLFRHVMSDVEPLADSIKKIKHCPRKEQGKKNKQGQDEAGRKVLDRLVTSGSGFAVENTPEYMEGTGYNVHRQMAVRLHRGDFSIQAHVDLHGHGVESAWLVFDDFLHESIKTGKRAVLIVHGRGLSSPVKPVLKGKVFEWLTRGPWRKWVLAFTSARHEDGGAGATYVLLRRKPVSKRHKKKPPLFNKS